jgi:hypothetical protein
VIGMKVFLSWSGARSNKVAEALREWLPYVVPHVEPYVSSEDIEKGARWATDIAKELEKSGYGIICLTTENITAPWILFEAGALSKFVEKSRVVPMLLDVKKSDLQGPLVQFQAITFDEIDVRKIVGELNDAAGEDAIEQLRIEKAFKTWWPQLKGMIEDISAMPLPEKKTEYGPQKIDITSISTMVEEVLELSRSQFKLLKSPIELLPVDYLRSAFGEERLEHVPRVDVPGLSHPAWRDLVHSTAEIDRLILDLKRFPGDPNENLISQLRAIRGDLIAAVRYITKSMPIKPRAGYSSRPRAPTRDEEAS